jgi:hypothetical protein
MQVIEAGAVILQGETGIGVPHGLARFCSGPAWAEAALSASLYRAATSRMKDEVQPHCTLLLVHPHKRYRTKLASILPARGIGGCSTELDLSCLSLRCLKAEIYCLAAIWKMSAGT